MVVNRALSYSFEHYLCTENPNSVPWREPGFLFWSFCKNLFFIQIKYFIYNSTSTIFISFRSNIMMQIFIWFIRSTWLCHCQTRQYHIRQAFKLLSWDPNKENRIYTRGEFTRKKCKTPILLCCFHTAGVLHIYAI